MDRDRPQGFPDAIFIRERLEKARDGDVDAAWQLIDDLIHAFDRGFVVPELYRVAADYFDELRRIREGKEGAQPSRSELAEALNKLYIVPRKRGRPRLNETVVIQRLAAERHLRDKGMSATAARGELADGRVAQETTMRDLRTDHPDLALFVDKVLQPGEREALADDLGAHEDGAIAIAAGTQGVLEPKASNGDVEAAWNVIDDLSQALVRGVVASKFYKFAADYFDELRRIREGKEGAQPSRSELAEALNKLYIVPRKRGRPVSTRRNNSDNFY
jgi:hypothetical protein